MSRRRCAASLIVTAPRARALELLCCGRGQQARRRCTLTVGAASSGSCALSLGRSCTLERCLFGGVGAQLCAWCEAQLCSG